MSLFDVFLVLCPGSSREDFKNISVERFVTNIPHTGHNLILMRWAESWNISIKMFILLAAVSVLQRFVCVNICSLVSHETRAVHNFQPF